MIAEFLYELLRAASREAMERLGPWERCEARALYYRPWRG